MNTQVLILFAYFHLYVCQFMQLCQLFSDNPKECVEKTNSTYCNEETKLGCMQNLNRNACIKQLTYVNGEEAQCIVVMNLFLDLNLRYQK